MPAQESIEAYPLATGNYWVYQIHGMKPALYLASGQRVPPGTFQKTLRSEITQVVYRRGGIEPGGTGSKSIAAATFDRFPPASPGVVDREEAPGILMIVGSRRIYQILDERSEIPGILLRVRDPNDKLSDLLQATPILDLPLAPGKQWGVPFSTWSVTQREKNSLAGVRGVGAASNRQGFALESSDNTGTVRFTFVPGIGITHVFSESLFPRGDSNHWEVESRLVEVHLNQTNTALPH
jgi:hypothetical protein